MHKKTVPENPRTATAEEVRQELAGWACYNPQDLFRAGAKCVAQVPGTTLVVPLVARDGMSLTIGFNEKDRSGLHPFEVETKEVAGLLKEHGVGLWATITWAGDGFYGHLQVWEPTRGVQDALNRLRGLFDTWPGLDDAGVELEAPPADSDKDIALLLWGNHATGTGQLGVSCDGTATVIAVASGREASREVLLEAFERVEPMPSTKASLDRTMDLATARVEVKIGDAADRLIERCDGPLDR